METPQRQTLLLKDARGETWWVDVSEAARWVGSTGIGGETVYHAEGRWIIVRKNLDAILTGQEVGELLSAIDALNWFLRRGLAVPNELRELAEGWRLQKPVTLQSRRTARRRKRRHRAARQAAQSGQPGPDESAGG
jgi:hypothetical protein